MTVAIIADALVEAEDFFRSFPDVANRAAMMALNTVAERQGIKLSAEEMMEQVNFPSGYLTTNDRLRVSRKATTAKLEAVITGRDRGTSLARFTTGGQFSKAGVTVQVKRGANITLKRAFLVKLKAGSGGVTDERYNVGLAIRLKPGEKLVGSYTGGVKMGNTGLTLMYGPSVNQIFADVADKISPELLDFVESEFYRNFERLTRE